MRATRTWTRNDPARTACATAADRPDWIGAALSPRPPDPAARAKAHATHCAPQGRDRCLGPGRRSRNQDGIELGERRTWHATGRSSAADTIAEPLVARECRELTVVVSWR